MLCGRHESLGRDQGGRGAHASTQGTKRHVVHLAEQGATLCQGIDTQPACQLRSFDARSSSRAPSPAQRAGSGSGTQGWPRVLRCVSSVADPLPAR